MNKIKLFWESLPKTVKVFVYMVVSTILAESLIELGGFKQVFIIRVLAQVINLLLVLVKDLIDFSKKR